MGAMTSIRDEVRRLCNKQEISARILALEQRERQASLDRRFLWDPSVAPDRLDAQVCPRPIAGGQTARLAASRVPLSLLLLMPMGRTRSVVCFTITGVLHWLPRVGALGARGRRNDGAHGAQGTRARQRPSGQRLVGHSHRR